MSHPLQRFDLLRHFGSGHWTDKDDKLFFSGNDNAVHRGFREVLFTLHSPNVDVRTEVVPLAHYGQYRYLIYAYGHCGWSRRLHELAFMNATILMEQSPCTEYISNIFTKDKHYASVAEDFSDIEVVLHRLRSNSSQAAEMAKDWLDVGLEAFSLECTISYIDALLREYAKLLHSAPIKHESWPVFTFESKLADFTGFVSPGQCTRPRKGQHIPLNVLKLMGPC